MEMFESKTVNFHTVLEGKKQQFLKIYLQPQSAQRLRAILFCGRHGSPPPPSFSPLLFRFTRYTLGFQNGSRYEHILEAAC